MSSPSSIEVRAPSPLAEMSANDEDMLSPAAVLEPLVSAATADAPLIASASVADGDVEDSAILIHAPQVTYGPSVNGYAVPLVDRNFEPLAIDEGQSFFVIDKWIFKFIGAKNSIARRSIKTTKLGGIIWRAFQANLGRHTRSQWFVDLHRQPVITVCAEVDGTQLEFLPPKAKTLAVKYTPTALDKILEIAIKEANGTLDVSAFDIGLAPQAVLHTRAITASDEGTTSGCIHTAALTALSEDDVEELKKCGIKWHPSKMRFVTRAGERNVRVPRAVKTKFKTSPGKLRKYVQGRIQLAKTKLLDHGDFESNDSLETIASSSSS